MDAIRSRLAPFLVCAILAGCGGGNGGPTGPDPNPDPDPDPDPDPTLELKGDSIFGIDLANRLFIVGTESLDVTSVLLPIQGLPPGHRIVGADFRPSDGTFFGVGTDSRVYVIDHQTAVATPVSQTQFQPAIFVGFDMHFGMTFDLQTERIRLVSTESGLNWSIDPDDGTAVTGPAPKYAAGDPNEGAELRLSGLAWGPSPDALAEMLNGTLQLTVDGSPDCDELLYAIDAELGWMVGTCDPDHADWLSLFDMRSEVAGLAPCAEVAINRSAQVDPTDPIGNTPETWVATNDLDLSGTVDVERWSLTPSGQQWEPVSRSRVTHPESWQSIAFRTAVGIGR